MISNESLLQLIQQGENFRLEAKKAEKGLPSSLWESYSAFCNSDGGINGMKEVTLLLTQSPPQSPSPS